MNPCETKELRMSDLACRPLFCDFCKVKCCESGHSCVCDPFSCTLSSTTSNPISKMYQILSFLLLLPARGTGIIVGLLAASFASKLAIVGIKEDQTPRTVCTYFLRGLNLHITGNVTTRNLFYKGQSKS